MELDNPGKTNDRDCKRCVLFVQDSLDVLRGKWKLPILTSLRIGPKRFKEISKEISGITDRILSRELKDLETNQLIIRTVHEAFPPKVSYTMTDHGLSLHPVILSLRDWGSDHRKKIIGK